jgi:hypothetical protein
MLNFSHQTRVFLFLEPVDMRKSFRGLCLLAESVLKEDTASGHSFAFINRRRDRLKLVGWDGQGFWIWYKKIESESPGQSVCTKIRLTSDNQCFRLAGTRVLVPEPIGLISRRRTMSRLSTSSDPPLPAAIRPVWF